MPETNSIVDSLVSRYWAVQFRKQLEPLPKFWQDMIDAYRVPDTRPWWKKRLSKVWTWIYWRTIGRFKNWLHRDCGDY